jgi:hypothetical protein
MTGASDSLGAVDPWMCRLSPWTPLIIAPEAVAGQLLGRFCPAPELIGASGPPPCRVMHRPCSRTPRIASG